MTAQATKQMSCNARIARFLHVDEDCLSSVFSNKLIPFGRVSRPHGITGEVKVDLSCLVSHDDMIDKKAFYDANGCLISDLNYIKCSGDRAIAKFGNCTDRDIARSSIRRMLFASQDNLRDDAAYFSMYYLVGMKVIQDNTEDYGTIVGVFNFGAGVVIEIFENSVGDTIFVPEYSIKDIDRENRSVGFIVPEIA